MTARLQNPNDAIQVDRAGVYELLEVVDSQCPGSIDAESLTYTVTMIPKPRATLSKESQANAEFVAKNRSYIIRPVCEGVSDHVDLDLRGMSLLHASG